MRHALFPILYDTCAHPVAPDAQLRGVVLDGYMLKQQPTVLPAVTTADAVDGHPHEFVTVAVIVYSPGGLASHPESTHKLPGVLDWNVRLSPLTECV